MRKVGIYGGTFDPVHNAHLNLAFDCLRLFGLDNFYFLPTSQNPLKDHPPVASPEQRLTMLELALRNEPLLDVLDWEIFAESPSYTIDTAQKIKQHWPHYQLYWVISTELLPQLIHWKDAYKLPQLVEFIVAQRPGFPFVDTQIPYLKTHPIYNHEVDISSTSIRQSLCSNMSVSSLLPEPVHNYLQVHNIYNESK